MTIRVVHTRPGVIKHGSGPVENYHTWKVSTEKIIDKWHQFKMEHPPWLGNLEWFFLGGPRKRFFFWGPLKQVQVYIQQSILLDGLLKSIIIYLRWGWYALLRINSFWSRWLLQGPDKQHGWLWPKTIYPWIQVMSFMQSWFLGGAESEWFDP